MRSQLFSLCSSLDSFLLTQILRAMYYFSFVETYCHEKFGGAEFGLQDLIADFGLQILGRKFIQTEKAHILKAVTGSLAFLDRYRESFLCLVTFNRGYC